SLHELDLEYRQVLPLHFARYHAVDEPVCRLFDILAALQSPAQLCLVLAHCSLSTVRRGLSSYCQTPFSFFHRPSAQAISSPRRLSMQMSSSSARAKDQSRGSHNVVGFFRSLAKSSFSALMKCSWSASVHTGPFSLIHFFPISTHLLSARER